MRSAQLTPMRQAIGRRMVASKQQAPHFYVNCDVDVSAALAHLHDLRNSSGERVGLTAYLTRATAIALDEHPGLNAIWRDDELMLVDEANIGIAIALDDGLVAPALFARDATNLLGTARAMDDLISRARAGKLRGAEMTEATFTLSNLGMFEVTSFIPIVTPPQVAILGVGRTRRVPAYEGDELVARSLVTLTVSADHRAVDGAAVARFLGTLKHTIERPSDLDE